MTASFRIRIGLGHTWRRMLAAGFAWLCPTLAVLAAQPPEAVPMSRAEVAQPEPSFQRALSILQQAKDKLAAGQTGVETQTLQKQVLAELDALLKSPPQKPPSSSSQGAGGGGQSESSQRRPSSPPNAKPESQSTTPDESSKGAQQTPAEQERERSQALDSEERTGTQRAGAAAVLPRRRLEVDVWGHLPEKMREQLLSGYGERMLPQYEELVRKFYESLAETGRK